MLMLICVVVFKQKTAYEMRISDWSSDVCSSDLVTTIEGLGTPERLHPMQAAFVDHDGFQCGYCTPGQICSSVAMLDEIRDGIPSHVTGDLTTVAYSAEDVRERISGNICRCADHPNIIDANREVQPGQQNSKHAV